MTKYLSILFVIFCIACSDRVTISEEDITPDIFYVEGSYKPFTGKCLVTYKDTCQVKHEFNYKKGILQGEMKSFYKNGQLKCLVHYNQGRISGKSEFWDEKGNLTLEANYKNDQLNGKYSVLYSNGKVKEKGQFRDDKRTGLWTYYDEQGRQITPIPSNLK